MYTLGYVVPSLDRREAIADGPSIRDYIAETAAEHGVTEKIRLRPSRAGGRLGASTGPCDT